jgi:hypothetical protein
MSSLTNINNNSAVVNVGRTTPVQPGFQPPDKSIPVVVTNTSTLAIPVIEQQKIQSEVALSLLGIPRGEVALGIFSDVNTYDVNPVEWSSNPETYTTFSKDGKSFTHGIAHLPEEAGALVSAPKNDVAVLTSKRFFRYQPGRVSSATFGVKSSEYSKPSSTNGIFDEKYDLNPAIRKYGIFDKYDGYYWETRADSKDDNFVVVRRTQSLLKSNPLDFGAAATQQIEDYRFAGKAPNDLSDEPNLEPTVTALLKEERFQLIEDAVDAALIYFDVGGAGANTTSFAHINDNRDKCERDLHFALDAYLLDLQYGGTGHTVTNATTYRVAVGPAAANNATNNAKRTAENRLHFEFRQLIKTLIGSSYNDRINTLSNIIRNAVGDGSTLGVQPSSVTLTSTSPSIWGRNKILSIFSIYKRFLAYLVSESFVDGTGPATYTASLKYKCYRDLGYIIDGYARDLAFGGNAATAYNMQNFYFALSTFKDLQVTSQFVNGYTVKKFHEDAHTLLKLLIGKTDGNLTTLTGTGITTARWDLSIVILKGASSGGFTSTISLFGLSSEKDKADNLADSVITNFDTPLLGNVEFGTGGQYGDLILYRDGLLMIHAAVNDPSLLKKKKIITTKVLQSNNQILEIGEGEYVVGQSLKIVGNTGDDPDGEYYLVTSVRGPRNNQVTLVKQNNDLSQGGIIDSAIHIDNPSIAIDQFVPTSNTSPISVETPVPFIFPKTYFEGSLISETQEIFNRYDGMFPLLYSSADSLPHEASSATASVGYVDTALDPASSSEATALRIQIDKVNYIYNNWVKQNVDPKYYAVYEYRVPRSRFSTDKLDGKRVDVPESNPAPLVYSDITTDDRGLRVRPGERVSIGDENQLSNSVWDIDLTKVTMLKIDFSWYGAVGALFLAYVPVGNGEARWVRVHHLRASNQLKISSLGNATLPITYLTYGGGDETTMSLEALIEREYGSYSEHIVKYGASYYIDGGDRGTVRLYSHTNNISTPIHGSVFDIGNITSSFAIDSTLETGAFTIDPAVIGSADMSYFMGAQVVTSSPLDQNVFVTWIDGSKLAINRTTLNSTLGVKLIAKRPSVVFGLKSKEGILNAEGFSVRNRVQVYPTKLSTANFSTIPVKLNIAKTPLFQTDVVTSGSFQLSSSVILTSSKTALPTSSTYLSKDDDFVYGWFRANIGSSQTTIFGKLFRSQEQYFFEPKESFTQQVILRSDSPFLKDGKFTFNGNDVTGIAESNIQKERLSSVFISTSIQSPIPNTGTEIASLFLSPGSEQFDLLDYFDYNKDYLSYPLTDQVDSIFLTTLSNVSDFNANNSIADINASLVWEEQ